MSRPRKYPEELLERAVRLALESGRPIAHVARDLGIHSEAAQARAPRGTPHTWQNVGTEPLRFFATIMPAAVAFEEFFKRYAQLPVEERGVEVFARLAAET